MLSFDVHSKRVFGVVRTKALWTLVGRLNMLGFHVVLHVLPGFTVVFAHTALESFTALVVQLPDSQDKAFNKKGTKSLCMLLVLKLNIRGCGG